MAEEQQQPEEKKRDTMTLEDVYSRFPELKMANELSHAMSESLRLTQLNVTLSETDREAIKLLQGLQSAYEKNEQVNRWMDGIQRQLQMLKTDSEMKHVLQRLLEAYNSAPKNQESNIGQRFNQEENIQ